MKGTEKRKEEHEKEEEEGEVYRKERRKGICLVTAECLLR